MSQLYRDQPRQPPPAQLLAIAGPAGPLETIVEDPGGVPPAIAVVCHPHPLYQGTMRNKVVHTLARAANRLGAPAVRFNFRGVGASGGSWDEGRGEIEDALAVAAWARQRWPGRPLWLAGFSFGAFAAFVAAGEVKPAALVTIAPPVTRFPIDAAPDPQAPWLLVQGEDDELVDFHEVVAWAKTRPISPRVVLLPGTSHFFHGRLGELQRVVQDFLGELEE